MKPPVPATPAERRRQGAALRRAVPRSAHAEWLRQAGRADPVDILVAQGANRIEELLPIRYKRMSHDAFAFLRGSAAVMAADLAHTRASGIRVQSCGDAHLANFGAFASPEGTPVFDVNDFDETLPAPFEWDLKRLAASLVVAARVAHYSDRDARKLAVTSAHAYGSHMEDLAGVPPLDAWNRRVDLRQAADAIDDHKVRGAVEKRVARVIESGAAHFGLVERRDGQPRLREKPEVVRHLTERELPAREALASYAETLQEERRVLLARYALQDVALKVVGVGSVGTLCAVGLLTAGDGTPLLLQIKEAQPSVLAAFAGASAYANHGERVVVGQQMLQAAPDIFLGWTLKPIEGRYFYVRRLKDSRLADIGASLQDELPFYASLCGHTLARAHARAGDAAMVAGYVGTGDAFEDAIGDFALAYADQNERDFASFLAAIKTGRIAISADS